MSFSCYTSKVDICPIFSQSTNSGFYASVICKYAETGYVSEGKNRDLCPNSRLLYLFKVCKFLHHHSFK